MSLKKFGIDFTIKYLVASALLIVFGLVTEIDLPMPIGFLVTMAMFMWSSYEYFDKNGVHVDAAIKKKMRILGLVICVIPGVLMLALFIWLLEMPLWIVGVGLVIGGAFTYLAVHAGQSMALNMVLKKNLTQKDPAAGADS